MVVMGISNLRLTLPLYPIKTLNQSKGGKGNA
jgi:hypothetical protein